MNTARELSDHLASLYRSERNAMADFLLALAAFDERKVWRELGYPSLWAFLRHELKLSKSAAYHRKTAAELIQTYPAVADALRSGELCLSTVAELARVLTPDNVGEVLPRFFGLSHREAEAVSASLRPAEVIPTGNGGRLRPSAPSRATTPAVSAGTPPSPPLPLPEPALALAPVPALEVSTPEPRAPAQAAQHPRRELSTTFLDAERARI